MTATTATETHRIVRGDGPFDMKAKCVRCGLGRGAKVHKVPAVVEAVEETAARAKAATVTEVTETIEHWGPDAVVVTREYTPADAGQCGIFGHEMSDGACAVCGQPDPATVPADELPAEMVHEHRAYRIGKVLREFVLAAEEETYPAALVEHIASRNVCYDGTATLRLCFIDAMDLSRAATDLENAALSGEFQAKAPAVMAARAARKSLAKLF